MNTAPTDGVVVDAVELRRLVEQIFVAVPVPEEHSRHHRTNASRH